MFFIRKIIPCKIYLQIVYFYHFRHFFSFKTPKSLNEKIQWLKINDRNSIYPILVDKVLVKKYVSNIIGEKYVIPSYKIWCSADNIEIDDLPEEFVLKCNHDSHCVFICKDKLKFNFNSAKKSLKKRLKFNLYWYGREWPYKNVKPLILAEKLLKPSSGDELLDYKILCFNGKPDNIMVCSGRQSGNIRYYYFDLNWNFLRYQVKDFNLPDGFSLPKPKHFDQMINFARELSQGLPLVRVDFYDTEEQLWFGELTLYPCAGFDTDITPYVDELLGSKLILPNK